ncbi:MAG TPA: response regulator transcription factor, partial [Myxococcaceae bacterium]|nr:response regulator transcription factor [Myxococcaceae bacterium]
MPIGVVLADDHALVRQGLRAVLEQDGFAVLGEASNGEEAIQLVQRVQPEIAILDVGMPVMNGLEA